MLRVLTQKGKFLFMDQPHLKVITFSYPIWKELFHGNFGHNYLAPY
jgi:hypothetical protein